MLLRDHYKIVSKMIYDVSRVTLNNSVCHSIVPTREMNLSHSLKVQEAQLVLG